MIRLPVIAILLAFFGSGLGSSISLTENALPKEMVRSFYGWYLKKATIEDGRPAWAKIIHEKPSYLSPSLRRNLARDLKRQARVSGKIEGIDFDPFLGGQDSCPRFAVGRAWVEGRYHVVRVRLLCAPGTNPAPIDVSVIRVGSRLAIDDVRYGKNNTLRGALQAQ